MENTNRMTIENMASKTREGYAIMRDKENQVLKILAENTIRFFFTINLQKRNLHLETYAQTRRRLQI